MSTFYMKTARVLCGVCPGCQSRTLECKRISLPRFRDYNAHAYTCRECSYRNRVSDETAIAAAEYAISSDDWPPISPGASREGAV